MVPARPSDYPSAMTQALRARFLTGLIGALFALTTVFAVFAHRMPTQTDVALARFVAMGGTVGDLCSTTGHRDLLQELSNLCAPDLAPALAAPGLRLIRFTTQRGHLQRPLQDRVCAAGACLLRPAIRAPPPRA